MTFVSNLNKSYNNNIIILRAYYQLDNLCGDISIIEYYIITIFYYNAIKYNGETLDWKIIYYLIYIQ